MKGFCTDFLWPMVNTKPEQFRCKAGQISCSAFWSKTTRPAGRLVLPVFNQMTPLCISAGKVALVERSSIKRRGETMQPFLMNFQAQVANRTDIQLGNG